MPYSRTTATAAMAAAQLPKGNNPVVDLLTRVPVNRGSLVKSIENLLKTIESSENAVMIPTLLRDKVRVDAWELLFVAKILKASILGHGDLVEFYMNHLNSEPEEDEMQASKQQAVSCSPQSANGVLSPQLQHGAICEHPSCCASSVSSTQSSTSTATNGLSSSMATCANHRSSGGSTSSWNSALASNHQQASPSLSSASSSSSSSSTTCSQTFNSAASSTNSTGSSTPTSSSDKKPAPPQTNEQQASLLKAELIGELARQGAQPQQQRQAQPPSLLQLTTTNNHINSLLQYPDPSPVADQLTVSTTTSAVGQASSAAAQQQKELRTSRSAGCLFRCNSSGASSPRTPQSTNGQTVTVAPAPATAPNTPLGAPQSGDSPAGELPGDPSALVKLLMQIEQLKSSIAHVSSQLESVVELYKKSIDDIST